MATTLKAHFDGEKITLDEPFDIPKGTPLIITVLSLQEERDACGPTVTMNPNTPWTT